MTDAQAEKKLKEAGLVYFWSRFGGWKLGRKDKDDDASHGYSTLAALYRNWESEEPVAELYRG